MRRARWLILAAITIIVFAVGSTYYGRLAVWQKDAPAAPTPLKSGVDSTAERWSFRQHNERARGPGGQPCPTVELTAKKSSQFKEPASYELEEVELKIFHRRDCGATLDQVNSGKASFDMGSGVLFSEGEVDIIMDLRADEAPSGKNLRVHSSGVYFETKTGKVYTDKPASFTFEHGDGKAVGADYDPTNRELHMKSAVELNWLGAGGQAEPMKVESGDLVYYEQLGKVRLQPWARMVRGPMKVEGGLSWVTLEDKKIRLVETENGSGMQNEDGRKVEWSAGHVNLMFNEAGLVTKVVGDQNARASSTTVKGRTDTRAGHVELTMDDSGKHAVLKQVVSWGQAVVESRPAAAGNTPPGDTRILRSEVVELKMRPGGKEIESVETHAPGTLEFVPVRDGQPHRILTGEKFWIAYGEENQIQSFKAVKAATRTEKPPRNGKPVPVEITSSDEFVAEFDPKTNQVARIEQTANFRYQAGDRTALSNKAVLDEKTSLVTLTGAARMSDPSGSATADQIVLNQKSGDVTAEGHVTSTRLPDKKGTGSAMLSNAEPTQVKSDRMASADDNMQLRYEGHVVAWQGANRIQADRLDIDREEEVMKATGSVVSQFADKPKKGKDGQPLPQAQTTFTIVRAPAMEYTEEQKLAHYSGGATLTRPNMTVKARDIRAFLKDAQSDSSLDHAVADGGVVTVQTAPGRTRTGTSEHAEYYAGEEKIVMTGGQPQFVDSLKGVTRGRILTYYSSEDRLLVNGVENQRAESTIKRK